ncbi:hypothetical protein [Streptomyces litchfieldiae]|uniref:Secreted protein n=1 Tax=Streptomyces litchfieldiae TaxID=3075543 RepID=A0ABU2MUH4_9ACTN|nr:hypothetical protein [Streptomyces sp. DSM 44938]MDT0345274.1 hypothetical protein [Streptomyces sp. DSM 44938]
MYAHLRTAAIASIAALSLALAPGRPAVADALSEQQLREALLDAVDFPEGWASDSERSAAERGFGVPRPTEPACDGLFDSERDGAVRAGFARTRSGPFVTTVAAAHRDDAAAHGDLAAVREAVEDDCATVRTLEGPEGGGVMVAYDAELLETADQLGDESVAIRFHRRVEGETTATPVVTDLVIARVGAQTVRIAQAGRDDESTGSVSGIAERAVEKLRQVAAGGTPAPRPDQPGTTEL